MSIASNIKDIFDEQNANAAFTFVYGYCEKYDGTRIVFEPGELIKEKRNKDNRVTFALYEYIDGSRLSYKYKEPSYACCSVVRKGVDGFMNRIE